ncbi:MAG TPA: leucyl/phenylalanyl-tRNA--protein transferase [Novosphingobium sp.]|nr:leucyl/phenylalanyl-tRNA--protein transferase [Novosphingobium sp.]
MLAPVSNRPAHALIDLPLLMLAYRSGIFPMADARDDPEVFWVEPKRRGILPLDGFHCARSLARVLKRGTFTVTCDEAFADVLAACAAPRAESPDTWINQRIAATYIALHAAGHAHSLECWQTGADGQRRLVGGLYGVGFDRVFCGESMFSRVSDASKVALAWLVAALRAGGYRLLDCQFLTDHLGSLGAVEISQKRYLELLRAAQSPESPHAGVDQRGASGVGAASGAAGTGAGSADAAEEALALPEAFGALLAAAKSAGFSSSPGNFIAQSFTQTS